MKNKIKPTPSALRRIPTVVASRIMAAAVAVLGLAANATDTAWQNGTASYTNASDWVGGIVPGPNDRAINDNGSNNVVQINVGNPDWTLNQLLAGSGGGNGAFLQNGQTLTISNTSR